MPKDQGLNKPLGQRTLCVHGGESPDPSTGASAPSIGMSSTFVTDEPSGFSAHDLDAQSPYLYGRWSNPTVRMLEEKLWLLEGAEACQCFASGMAATSAIFFTNLSVGDHAIISDVSYAGVAELARDTLPRFGIEVSLVDFSDLQIVDAAIRPQTKLIYAETPVNPILRLTDLSELAAIGQKHNVKTAVDSTFATPLATKPIDLGIDYVMHSLTKYFCGHGDAIGGAVLGNREDIKALNIEAAIHHGGVLSPFNAWLIARGMATLPVRMEAHERNAFAVARHLQDHPKIQKVLYPGLASHPQHKLALSQMRNFSGMLGFRVEKGERLAEIMAAKLQIIHYAVSLGHQRSLIFWMGTDGLMDTSFRLEGPALESYRRFAGDGIFRMSVGLEDADDIIADLDAVLNLL